MGRKKGYKLTEEQKNKIREACRNCPVVHHINGNHFDDRSENRMILTPSEHIKIHMLQGDVHIFKRGNEHIKNTWTKGKHWKWKKNQTQINIREEK